MDKLTLEYMKSVIKKAAKNEGVSEEEFRASIEEIIDIARNNPTHDARFNFKTLFDKTNPSVEEFIFKLSQIALLKDMRDEDSKWNKHLN